MDDCFNYYNDKITSTCQNCGNQNATKWVKICFPARVLIIVFERNNHSNINDVYFPINLNMRNYISQKRNNSDKNYVLNSCISYNNNSGNFFADCCIKYNWYF